MSTQLSIAALVARDAAQAEMERAREIAARWDAYQGRHKKPLVVRPKEPDDNVIVNLTGVVVDASVDFLFGDDLTFEIESEGDPEESDAPIEQWLDQVWDDNSRMTLLQKLGTAGAVAGHAAIKIQPDADLGKDASPRLILIDQAGFSVTWDQDDIERVLEYRITWTIIEDGRPAVRRQRIARDGAQWTIVDEVSRGDRQVWTPIGEEAWPFSWAPVIDCQNLPVPNEYWGRSDLTDDVVEVNRAINGLLSDLRKGVRINANPKVWAKGVSENSRLDVAPDEAIILPGEDAEVGVLLGRIDPSAIELYHRLKAVFHEQARTPEIASGKLDDIGQLSGLALQILYGPLVRLTKTKRRTYGDLMRKTNRGLLEWRSSEAVFGGRRRTLIHWPELLPTDPREDAEVAVLDHDLGASRDTLLRKRGYDPDQELPKRQEEDRQRAETAQRAFDAGAGGGGGGGESA